jgi:hypothetical protein
MGLLGEPPTIVGGPVKRAPAGLCGAWGIGLAVAPPGRELAGWRREYTDADGGIWSNPFLLSEVRVVGRAKIEPDDQRRLAEMVMGLDFESTAVVDSGAPPVRAGSVQFDVEFRVPARLRVNTDCDGPCLLVVAQSWAPGWQAWVDGRRVPVVRTNIAGLGVVAPEGRHSVELAYHPWSW